MMFQAIRGMNDILPDQSAIWRYVENNLVQCLQLYGYQELRMPYLESTDLFKRSIGEVTDVVEKEMYTFSDLNGDSISLRPEGTAGCVRACLQHGLLRGVIQKLWYMGPMFRHEKPQKGRQRQFNQLGVEVFGVPGVSIELELLALCHRFWKMLGVSNALQLEIHTLGTLEERARYKKQLVDYLEQYKHLLDVDSQKRLLKNPLRILDSKHPDTKNLIQNAPKLLDELGVESRERFDNLCSGLDLLGISYTINPCMVRGLDYYGQMIFEWTAYDYLGSQATVCAGGRFDALISQLGGKDIGAVGFALGMERLLLVLESVVGQPPIKNSPDVFAIALGDNAMTSLLKEVEQLRSQLPIHIAFNHSEGSIKSQLKKADKSGAKIAIILGDDELKNKQVLVKNLRDNTEQRFVALSDLNLDLKRELVL